MDNDVVRRSRLVIWEMHPIDAKSGAWDPWYDTCQGLIVAAVTEQEARRIASATHGAENYDRPSPWLDPSLTECVELVAKLPGVIMSDVWEA